MMQKTFDPDGRLKIQDGTPKPYDGKKMLLIGDSAQLRPVAGVAIYDLGSEEMPDNYVGRNRRSSYVSSQVKLRPYYIDILQRVNYVVNLSHRSMLEGYGLRLTTWPSMQL